MNYVIKKDAQYFTQYSYDTLILRQSQFSPDQKLALRFSSMPAALSHLSNIQAGSVGLGDWRVVKLVPKRKPSLIAFAATPQIVMIEGAGGSMFRLPLGDASKLAQQILRMVDQVKADRAKAGGAGC